MDPSNKATAAQLAARNIKIAKSRHQRRSGLLQKDNFGRSQALPQSSESGLFGGGIQASSSFNFASPSTFNFNSSPFGALVNPKSESAGNSDDRFNGDDRNVKKKFEQSAGPTETSFETPNAFSSNQTMPNFCSESFSKPKEASIFSFQGGFQSGAVGESSAPTSAFSFASTSQPAASSCLSFGTTGSMDKENQSFLNGSNQQISQSTSNSSSLFGNLAPASLSGSSQISFFQNPESSQSSNVKNSGTLGTPTNIFGQLNAKSMAPSGPTLGLFSDATIKPVTILGTSNLFGGSNPKSTATSESTSLFADSNVKPSSKLGTPTNIFGGQNSKPTVAPGHTSLFGDLKIEPVTTLGASTNIFAESNPNSTSTSVCNSGLFVNSLVKPASTSETPANIFGDQNSKSMGTTGSTMGMFGNSSLEPMNTPRAPTKNFAELNAKPKITSEASTNIFAGLSAEPKTTSEASTNIFAGLSAEPKTTSEASTNIFAGLSAEPKTTSEASTSIFAESNAKPKTTSEASTSIFAELNAKSMTKSGAFTNIISESNAEPTTTSGASINVFAESSAKSMTKSGASTNIISQSNAEPMTTSGTSTNIFAESNAKSITTSEASTGIFAELDAKPKTTPEASTNIFAESNAKSVTTPESSTNIFAESNAKSITKSEASTDVFAESNEKPMTTSGASTNLFAVSNTKSTNTSGSTTCISTEASVKPEITLGATTSLFGQQSSKNLGSDVDISIPSNMPANLGNIFNNPHMPSSQTSNDDRHFSTKTSMLSGNTMASKSPTNSAITSSETSSIMKFRDSNNEAYVTQQQSAVFGNESLLGDKETFEPNTNLVKSSTQNLSENKFCQKSKVSNLFAQIAPETSTTSNTASISASKILPHSDTKQSAGCKTITSDTKINQQSLQTISNKTCNPFSSLKQDLNVTSNTGNNIFGFLEKASSDSKSSQSRLAPSTEIRPSDSNDTNMIERQKYEKKIENSKNVSGPGIFSALVDQVATNQSIENKLSESSSLSSFQQSINTGKKSSPNSSPRKVNHLSNDANFSIEPSTPDTCHSLIPEKVNTDTLPSGDTIIHTESSRLSHTLEESDKALIPYNPAPGSKRRNIFAPKDVPEDPLLRKLALVSQIKDDDIEAIRSYKSDESDRQQYFATYRLRALNQAMARMFADLPITSDPQVALNFYTEERRIILENCSVNNNNFKRKADSENNEEQGPQKKRKQQTETEDFTMLLE